MCVGIVQYFPVILEDYDNTTDRPQCEKKPHETHYEEQVGLDSLYDTCLPLADRPQLL